MGITETPNQTIAADGFLNSLATMTWWWQTHLAPTKHPAKSPGTAQAERHNQINYIMVKKRFKTSVNIAKTRSFPGADIRSDYELIMVTFKLHLKRAEKKCNTRIRCDLEELKDPEVSEIFQPKIGGKFAVLSILDSDIYVDTLTDTFNTAETDTANEILGKYRLVKKPWVTNDILYLCAECIKLKNKDRNGMAQYRAVNQKIRKGMKKATENWIGEHFQKIDDCLKNNSKKAYKLVQDLTGTKQERTTTIQEKGVKCLTKNKDILKRWTEYCSELYNYRAIGDPEVFNVPPASNNANHPILFEEVEAAVKSLKKGKSAGVDNIPPQILQQGGEAVVNALLIICNKIWWTGEWPTPWTQSIVIALPKNDNLQLCQNYRIISLISHPSKVMLKIILNRLEPEAEKIIAEEQAGFRPGRSTTEQIFNLRILCERYL